MDADHPSTGVNFARRSTANALRDASPDAWGRRVIAHRLAGGRGGASEIAELDELTFMLRSGSDRTGALDFQASPRYYLPREAGNETLERLLDSADHVDRGLPLAPDLAEALQHGTAIVSICGTVPSE